MRIRNAAALILQGTIRQVRQLEASVGSSSEVACRQPQSAGSEQFGCRLQRHLNRHTGECDSRGMTKGPRSIEMARHKPFTRFSSPSEARTAVRYARRLIMLLPYCNDRNFRRVR